MIIYSGATLFKYLCCYQRFWELFSGVC
jgi:hypothetical protein